MFCFFFQAEDGIRDDLVTGVQTCALPIFFVLHDQEIRPEREARREVGQTSGRPALQQRARSEERRVGKECRSRWARDPSKKKRRRTTRQQGDKRRVSRESRDEPG